MSKKKTASTRPVIERAFMVGVGLKSSDRILTVEDSLDELALLAETAGLEVAGFKDLCREGESR